MNIDELALKVWKQIHPSATGSDAPAFARALIAEYEAAGSEPVTKRFNCWSTNEGDSWYDHPADAQLLEDVLGNEPKVGDEFEVMAGWHCVQAKYKIVSQDGDDFEVECLSHPFDTSPARPDPRVAELEAQLAEANEAAEFNFEQYHDAGKLLYEECEKTDLLEAQNAALLEQLNTKRAYNGRAMSVQDHDDQVAALLVVIEYVAGYISEREDWAGKNALLQDIALKLASTLSPSAELLEARDRKRDAKLLRVAIGGFHGELADHMNALAGKRESGEWQPEI